MEKTIATLLSLITAVCLAACGNSTDQAERSSTENHATENTTGDDAKSSMEDDAQAPDEAESADGTADIAASGTKEAGSSKMQQPEEKSLKVPGSKVLVAYFSATNTTEGVAEHIANGLNADIYEIMPEDPYTDEDLNYNDNNSRSTVEMNDPSSRPAISGSVENMEQYDIVFVGYPIWWGEAPRIVSTFVESYDFSGKTVVPFCTSGGSGVGFSATNLEKLTDGARWLEGHRLNGNDSRDAVMEWVNGLGLDFAEQP